MSEQDDKVKYAIDWIQRIDGQYAELKTNNVEAFDYYFGRNYMEDVPGRSKIYTSDLLDTVEWIMPSLIKIFAGGDDVTSLTPRKKEFADEVERHNELINYQIKVKNNWFLILNDWFKDALMLKRGAVKYQWFEATINEEKNYENLTEMEFAELSNDPDAISIEVTNEIIAQPESIGTIVDPETGIPIETIIPAIKLYDCTIEYRYFDEYPIIEAVPAEEYGFPVETRSIDACSFFYHRVKYDKWGFIKRFGEENYTLVEQLKGREGVIFDDAVGASRFSDISGLFTGNFFWDEKDGKWAVYECFFTNPDTGEPWILVICGDKLLEDKKNKYGKPNFEFLTPVKLSHRIIGMSMFDLLKDLQRIRTALIRQMLDTGYYCMNPVQIVDPLRINFEDFLQARVPGGYIRTRDGQPATAEGILALPTQPLPAFSFELLEMINKEKDYHSGVPRSFQGVNPNVMNKTMRGQFQQVELAQQRIEMMARLFAEMGIAPLIRNLKDMNSKFLSKKVALKVVNDWLTVTPEDVVAKADVIINVGLGTASKDILVQQNQQMIALYMQLYPIFNKALDDKILHSMKELVKAMGYRDIQNWIPGEEEMMEAQQQMLMQAQIQAAGQGTATQPGQNTNSQATQPMQPRYPGVEPGDWGNDYFG